jgi:hypothetical protein
LQPDVAAGLSFRKAARQQADDEKCDVKQSDPLNRLRQGAADQS